MRHRIRLKPVSPIVLTVATFLAVIGFMLVRTVIEADQSDTERTRAMIVSAVDTQIRETVDSAKANAIAAGRHESLSAIDTDGRILVLDSAFRPLPTHRDGSSTLLDPQQDFGTALSALAARALRDGSSGSVVRSPEGPMLLALAETPPTPEKQDSSTASPEARWLLVARPFDQAAVDRIGRSLVLKDLRLTKTPQGNASLAIHDANGAAIAMLGWTPTAPALKALAHVLPWIVIAILLHFAFGIRIGRNALRSVARLADEALIDSLSGLPNRRALRKRLERKLDHGESLALALIDLDGFKGINDNFGHHVGDRLIKSMAGLLAELVGTKGMVARLGGDEFAIMTSGDNAVETLQDIAAAMLHKLARPFRIDERTVLVGASIGLAAVSRNALDSGELMRRADVAMYSAKRAGKMRLAWYDETLDRKQAIARTIELELRRAIENESFGILYLPVVDIHHRRIVAAEALLRWTSPTRGDVGPEEFIPVAEETGLIDRIGMIVLRRACRDGLGWGDVRLAINVSAAQLRNPEFAVDLGCVLEETGFPAARLELDITEAFLAHDPDSAHRVLRAIQALGVSVALEDDGTGFGSIGFLRQFSFDKVKLDRVLVSEAAMSAEARAIVQAKIAVARALNMSVAAAGVETEDQADMMRVAGCDQLQGWLFSKPVTSGEVTDRLAKDYPDLPAARSVAM